MFHTTLGVLHDHNIDSSYWLYSLYNVVTAIFQMCGLLLVKAEMSRPHNN